MARWFLTFKWAARKESERTETFKSDFDREDFFMKKKLEGKDFYRLKKAKIENVLKYQSKFSTSFIEYW